jgi:hypothetical protein
LTLSPLSPHGPITLCLALPSTAALKMPCSGPLVTSLGQLLPSLPLSTTVEPALEIKEVLEGVAEKEQALGEADSFE